MEAVNGGEYGVDFAQNEVPPVLFFGLELMCTDGNIAMAPALQYQSYYKLCAVADRKAFDNMPKQSKGSHTIRY